jgi:hypothetical protein
MLVTIYRDIGTFRYLTSATQLNPVGLEKVVAQGNIATDIKPLSRCASHCLSQMERVLTAKRSNNNSHE